MLCFYVIFTVGLLPCHQSLCSSATGLQADTRGCWVIERVSSPGRHRTIPLKFRHTPARVNRPRDSSGRVPTLHHFCRFLLSFFYAPTLLFPFLFISPFVDAPFESWLAVVPASVAQLPTSNSLRERTSVSSTTPSSRMLWDVVACSVASVCSL